VTAAASLTTPCTAGLTNRGKRDSGARVTPTALDNGQRSPRKLLKTVVERLLGWKPRRV
jgi:hypothetical protein